MVQAEAEAANPSLSGETRRLEEVKCAEVRLSEVQHIPQRHITVDQVQSGIGWVNQFA